MGCFTGHLELVCALDCRQKSYLRQQSFRAPFYINKPYHDRDVLMVQVINPTAGLFSGDHLRSHVQVDTGARLYLSSPSACRVHAMPTGRAESIQHFAVSKGGWLEVSAPALIPQADSRLRQETRIDVAIGGELFFQETLSPGRVARGEVFAYRELDWELNLHYGDALVVRERYRLAREGPSFASFRQSFPAGFFASSYLVSERALLESPVWAALEAMQSEDLHIGCSRLFAGGWCIKMLARDSLTLRRALRNLRENLAQQWPALRADVRRL
jgi:urease accessory protein